MRKLSFMAVAVLWSANAFANPTSNTVSSDQAADMRALRALVFSQEPGSAARRAYAAQPRLSAEARAAMAAPAPVLTGQYLPPNFSWGFNIGIVSAIENPIRSSTGFYTDGNVERSSAGLLVGTSFFYNGWRFGSGVEAFSNYTLSLGVVIDYFSLSSPSMIGRCGGSECRGGITIHQFNVIPEIKLTTSISQNTTANVYYGWGVAVLSPTGEPIFGGPKLVGSDTAFAHRVGGGISQRLSGNLWWDFKTGYQWTGPTEFETNLAGERMQFGTRGDYYVATGMSVALDDEGWNAIKRLQRNY
jgi:hypothetical protein